MKSPSEIHPSLTDEHIDLIGGLIARVRAENLMNADPRDDGWSLGCRAYTWCRSELINLAQAGNHPWLSIKDPGLRFVFRIGTVEVSFYKGSPENPKNNIFARSQSFPEIKQLGLLPLEESAGRLVWTYAVETDLEGTATNIEFIGLTESGNVIASRRIDLVRVATSSRAFDEVKHEPIEQAPAKVTLNSR